MASGKETDGFRVSGLKKEEKILDGHLFVRSAVDQKKRCACLVEPSLSFEGEGGHYFYQLRKSSETKEVGSGFDQIEEIRGGVSGFLLPLRLKEIMDGPAPIDHRT